MANIRFMAVFAVAALLCPSWAGAERGQEVESKGPGILTEKYLERLEDQLKLKGKQKDKIESVLKDARPGIKKNWKELKALKKKMKAAAKKMRNSMREVQENIREQLDYDQKEKFDEMRMRQKQMRRRKQRRRRRRPGRPERAAPNPREFPPERFEMETPGRRPRDLPPELRKRINERQRRRMDMEPGYQRDLPPVEEWNDQRRPKKVFPKVDPLEPDD